MEMYTRIAQAQKAKRKRQLAPDESPAASSEAGRSTKERRGRYNDGWDDENYDYVVQGGDVFLERYELDRVIGRGSFGQASEGIRSAHVSNHTVIT